MEGDGCAWGEGGTAAPVGAGLFERGLVSEENLEWLRQRGALYLVGTPRSQWKKHPAALLDQTHWKKVRPGVEAHILVSFLSLALWRRWEQWMRAKGLGDCARPLLLELDELRSMDVILPTRAAGEIGLRVVARPEKALAQLRAHPGLDNHPSSRPRTDELGLGLVEVKGALEHKKRFGPCRPPATLSQS
jgi:hypothetical protein